MTPLQKAAQALIERWDSPAWKDQPHTAEYILTLRKALDAEIAQAVEPVARVESIMANGRPFISRLPGARLNEGDALYLHPPQPQATTSMSDFDMRGVLASNLLCWKRLTEAEAQDLVCFFEKVRTAQGEK